MTFWEAFKSSVILSALIALVIVFTICYLAIVNQPIPDVLTQWGGTFIAFYFVTAAAV